MRLRGRPSTPLYENVRICELDPPCRPCLAYDSQAWAPGPESNSGRQRARSDQLSPYGNRTARRAIGTGDKLAGVMLPNSVTGAVWR